VSAVLNETGRVGENTRRRVLSAVEAIGYSPNAVARSLRLGRSNLIGVVVGDITNPFSAEIIRVVEKAALARGYSVIVCNLDGDDERVPKTINQLRGQHVAGILLAPVGGQPGLIEQIESHPHPPVVTFDKKLPGLACDYVGVDNRAAMRMLIDYLVRLGHERIAIITGQVGDWTADARYEGFVEAMAKTSLPIDVALVARSGYDRESVYTAAATVMTQRQPPTAIVAASNVMTLGALQSCIDLGFQCPADISIVGVDDVPWSGLVRPKLTIVTQPIEKMGSIAIEWLLERIEAPGTPVRPRELILQLQFRPGESCRDIRASAAAPNVEAPGSP
jgi:LacI family transcriptional regulator